MLVEKGPLSRILSLPVLRKSSAAIARKLRKNQSAK
jgi:hypothetical protein